MERNVLNQKFLCFAHERERKWKNILYEHIKRDIASGNAVSHVETSKYTVEDCMCVCSHLAYFLPTDTLSTTKNFMQLDELVKWYKQQTKINVKFS